MRLFGRSWPLFPLRLLIAGLFVAAIVVGGCRAAPGEKEGTTEPAALQGSAADEAAGDAGESSNASPPSQHDQKTEIQTEKGLERTELYVLTPDRTFVVRLRPETSRLEREVAMTLSEFQAEKKDEQTTRLTLPGHILFDFDSYALRPEAQETIDKLVQVLEYAGDKAKVTIVGHTDNVGSAAYNQTLSEKRAQAVLEALAERGIDRARMTAVGKGMTEPVADNATEAGRQKNRRVEVLIEGLTGLDALEEKRNE
ncbi:MAG: OmpA family protein [Hydrogenibacillus sp.]|nr:OmpA family protein [Hydrogenibacillus sp.]